VNGGGGPAAPGSRDVAEPLAEVSLRGSAPVCGGARPLARPFILSFLENRRSLGSTARRVRVGSTTRGCGGLPREPTRLIGCCGAITTMGDDHRCSGCLRVRGSGGGHGDVAIPVPILRALRCSITISTVQVLSSPSRPPTDAVPLLNTDIRGPRYYH
jgi:hypothetical protein